MNRFQDARKPVASISAGNKQPETSSIFSHFHIFTLA